MSKRPKRSNVYVIELDPSVLEIKKFAERNKHHKRGMPCVYVGMTGWTPTKRFQNHKRGHKANRFARKFGLRLMPELYDQYNPMEYDEANEMEVKLANDLRKRGFAVWQG